MFESLSFVHQERYENFKRFVSTHVEPFADEWDRNQHMPADIIRKIAAEGYFGAIVLPKYGGQGWDNLSYGLLNEAFGFGSSSLTVLFTVQNMVGSSILRWGTEAQHRSWLEPMAQGDIIAAFALTEPETGSDLQSITVNLEDRSSHLVLNGTKRWITFAATADVILVFGKLNNKPVACIVERDMPGVTITPIKDMMGFRACHLAQLDFENVEIPVENVIGRAGYGLSHVAPVGLHCGRLSTAFSSAGLIRACLEASVKRAGSRVVSGTALNNYSSIRSIIVQMGLDYDTSMLWCLEAAKAEDNRMCNAAETTIGAKYVASQNAMKAAANAIQIGGAYGCHEASSSTGRFYRDAKIMEIIEGTSQVLQNVLGTHYITSYQPAAKKAGLEYAY
ncbi:acyl-CoA/acyl-ACP dehydrogenase [Mucilaginibacter sp. 21P]|uniref:acyl-CoA dehydrogenase family protein n=1 Tax=Mucilaginibacter sp. 21P TaxID=2778902 RepID=UPI001C59F75E|nr:acyl-CoA dehydrogenase family protein [Mucilaginibacter sp. 21P]QXV63895.1 acyl-CoA/acyl-ACP dehydrogenase [Mucilaginibacter sp. 21P]